MRIIGILLFISTWILSVFHMGTAPSRDWLLNNKSNDKSQWIPKEKFGINQLILFGTPVERGLFAGKATEAILLKQERGLQEELSHLIPNSYFRRALFFSTMRLFSGIDHYLKPWMLDEMWGVAESTSNEFNFLADKFTRQIAYHGLHEVGQMMVDMVPQSMGCTVLAVPSEKGWVIGRNFDFEGGRIFDEEKIMKWVFPHEGYAYLSIIWAGMVGAVTGVNENGVYISINAAGSTDFKRIGTPSTLVVTEALQFSKSAEEAVKIIQDAQMFITDIFVVGDSKGSLYRLEKSAKKTIVIHETEPVAITNHLIDKVWAKDRINEYRRNKMTSTFRQLRGQELLNSIPLTTSKTEMPPILLNYLRDKKLTNGENLTLGNRKAIDALIATHSTIWDGETLYVSQGPALVGAFIGIDLKQSFSKKFPVVTQKLNADSTVNLAEYERIYEERMRQRRKKIK